mgnify:CR=1 FL=1
MDLIVGIILIFLAVFLIAIVVMNVKIVPQSKAYVIERLGAYSATWQTGIHVKIPFIERIAKQVSLKEQIVDFPPQPVITKDNVTMQIDTVVFFQITDPKLFAYGVERPLAAIENLTATTLRNILAAEADKQSAILAAEAIKEAKIREAEGEAEAIIKVEQARAKAIELINSAAPGDGYLTIKSLEAFEAAADGKATKLIIPSNLQGLAGLAAGVKEIVSE